MYSAAISAICVYARDAYHINTERRPFQMVFCAEVPHFLDAGLRLPREAAKDCSSILIELSHDKLT